MLKVKIKSSCIHACIHEKTLDKQNIRAYTTSTTNKKAGPTIAIGLANKGG